MKNIDKVKVLFLIVLVSLVTSVPGWAQKPKPQAPATASTKVSDDAKVKAEEFFKKGQAAWKELEITEAIDNYSKALAIYPNYPDALRERGLIYYLTSRYELAISDFNAGLKLEPNQAKVLYYRGLALANIANRLLETEIDRKSANDHAQRSLDDLNRAIELQPNESLYYNGRGKLLFDFDFYKEAVADFEKSISLYPKGQYAYTYLGYAKFRSNTGTGLGDLGKALEIDPKFADAYFVRGNIHRRLRLFDEALKDFDEAIKLNKYNSEYYNARGLVYFLRQDGDAAVKDFSRAISEKNDFGMAYFNRAMTYKKFPYSVSDDPNLDPFAKIPMQIKKIQEDLTSAIKHQPNLAEGYLERAKHNLILVSRMGEMDAEDLQKANEVLADFNQAIKINPQLADAYNGRASVYRSLGKKDLALADYHKAIELDPDLGTAYLGRMGIYCEMGQKELSIADEKKAEALGLAAINVCNLGK